MWNVSQRRFSSAKVTLDKQSLVALNDCFADLCQDTAYIQPTPLTVSGKVEVPEILERQVWNCLQHLKKNSCRSRSYTFLGMERPCKYLYTYYSQDLDPFACLEHLAFIVEKSKNQPSTESTHPKRQDRLQGDQLYTCDRACLREVYVQHPCS